MTLLEELFEQPHAKAIVFSQWLRTHELIVRRLDKRGWGYALFHGGVPSAKRGALVERFHREPGCRVFLSTDAGGVGLNLQHAASIVVNMDVPWNPAVLEQRIGRVHRLGQSRSVQVVNFVAEDTIEERMLSLLAFKKSLFAGVLDGGASEVFLGGPRLAKFMESVTAVTEQAVKPERESKQGTGLQQTSAFAPKENQNPDASTPNPWAPLLSAGLKLVEALASATSVNSDGKDQPAAASPLIEVDAQTGRSYLKLPMPEPQVVQQLSDALLRLLAGVGR